MRVISHNLILGVAAFILFGCWKTEPKVGIKIDDLSPPNGNGRFATDFGERWAQTDISVSIIPDGTNIDGTPSCLFAHMNAVASIETWKREYARALQTWAEFANINFRFVFNDGSPRQSIGLIQGDPRFGDIRLGMKCPGPGSALASTGGPDGGAYGFTSAGDIALHGQYTFRIGTTYDFYSVLLHEIGHSLGLDHSGENTVMYGVYEHYCGLTSDDIDGIRTLYGPRQPDTHEVASGLTNDSFASATSLMLDSTGGLSIVADITKRSDVDYYRVEAPLSFDGTLSISVEPASLLAATVSVFNAQGVLVASGSAGQSYGTTATVNLAGLSNGATYFIKARGATSDVFATGKYRLIAKFGGAVIQPAPSPPADLIASASSSSQIDLSWRDTSSNEFGFKIERSSDGITFSEIGSVIPDTDSYSDKNFSGSTFYYRVFAYNATGPSIYSNTASATIPSQPSGDRIPPTVNITFPTNNQTVAKGSSITITADATDNVAVTSVEFYVDGQKKCTVTTFPFSCVLKIGGRVGRGNPTSYQIYSKASDAASNYGTSFTVSFSAQ